MDVKDDAKMASKWRQNGVKMAWHVHTWAQQPFSRRHRRPRRVILSSLLPQQVSAIVNKNALELGHLITLNSNRPSLARMLQSAIKEGSVGVAERTE